MNGLARLVYGWTGVGHGGQPNTAYSFWSGIGSCLTYIGILAAGWRHLNCHARGCLRVGRHQVPGTAHKTCRRHHPTLSGRAPTVEQIHADHLAGDATTNQ